MLCDIDSFIRAFKAHFPSCSLPVVSRAPGRINLLGQHVDHQGGYVNPIAIDKSIMVGISPRKDSLVHCKNLDAGFDEVTYNLEHFVHDIKRMSWQEYVDRHPAVCLPRGAQHWGRYVMSPILYFHRRLPMKRAVTGYNVLVTGDVPIASGLSSSSSLVVATGLALCESNGWHYHRSRMIRMFGEAEFFAGALSGFGDQAAILSARERHVTHIMFFPLRILRYVEFPEDYTILVCHSGERAEKSNAVQHHFNFKVAGYHLARMWLKRHLPAWERECIKCLRHLLPKNEGRALGQLYRLMQTLPENATVQTIRNILSHERETVERLLASCNKAKEHFDLRGVCMFGLSEMSRSRRFIRELAARRMGEVAEIMNISHNGDRITQFDPERQTHSRFVTDYSDSTLRMYAETAETGTRKERRQVALWRQPGRYRCSTRRLDEISDIVHSAAPDAGAHLSGGGLGGAIIVICRKAQVDTIITTLARSFYSRYELPVMIEEFTSAPAAEIISR